MLERSNTLLNVNFTTDKHRYKKIFKSNYYQLLERTQKGNKKKSDKPVIHLIDPSDSSSRIHWIFAQEDYQENVENATKEQAESRILISTRMRKALNFNFLQLVEMARTSFERKHYNDAQKLYSLAIDKMFTEHYIVFMDDSTQIECARLFYKRAQSNMELGKIRQSLVNVNMCLEDCSYVLHAGSFKTHVIESQNDLYQGLIQLKKKAEDLQTKLATASSSITG